MIRAYFLLTFFLVFILTTSLSSASDFVFSKSISKNKVNLILDDLEYLKRFDFNNTYPRTYEAFEMNHFDGSSVYNWINHRVTYFVDDNILSRTNILLFTSLYKDNPNTQYPNARVLPYSLNPKSTSSKQSINYLFSIIFNRDEESVMSNLGASLYLKGKFEQKIYYAKLNPKSFSNKLDIAIESPRIGLLKVGKGFFNKTVSINHKRLHLPANRISRLMVLAHEARHSDGNAESLSFAHSRCPIFHYLSGKSACDENLNGPYTIGAQLGLEMLKSEQSLNNIEKAVLKAIVLDSQSRVLNITNNGNPLSYWDSDPEALQK